DYGARAAPGKFSWMTADRYIVLLHATSADRKLWREANWIDLGRYFRDRGVACVLPWGNNAERERSVRLAAQISGAIVPPALELGDAAALLAGAHAAAGVDTGLLHLAAALGVPTIGIYCATDPGATGIYACQRGLNLGGAGKPPAANEVIAALEHILA
ncbi:MAG: glycosyltransferase family 9 protein, partial [Burkholderiales bacterium]|nr:glycosyltransferase family 9 protein [Burkholderiales bacterium]